MAETRTLEPEEWELWDAWMRAQRLLARELDRGLQRDCGISKAEFSVLVTLWQAPGREMRVGALVSDNARMYVLEGPITPGDSGGPVVHIDTGRALGVVSRIVAGCCAVALPVWQEGPTVSGLVLDAGVQGFTVQLRTV
jgi:hypothetical protein